jgi:hypothetical protein
MNEFWSNEYEILWVRVFIFVLVTVIQIAAVMRQITRGSMKVIPSIFFSETVITSIINFTCIMDTSFRKLRLFFRNFSFTVNTISQLCVRHCMSVCRIKLFAEASELFKHAVFHVVVVKSASTECILQGAHQVGAEGAKSGLYGKLGLDSYLRIFSPKLRSPCFNFFNVRTYRSDLIVATVFKNSANKVPTLSQKTLVVTLPAKACILILSSWTSCLFRMGPIGCPKRR